MTMINAHQQTMTEALAETNDLEMIEATRPVLELLSGKWTIDVLYLLATGTRRYSEVFYEVGPISKKALTQTLRVLERGGLVHRRVLPEVPARVEYSLSQLGWSLTGLLMSMYEWGVENLQDRELEPELRIATLSLVPDPASEGARHGHRAA
jgi:DNA-binding HxlR family transcriptional regulator